MKSQHNDYVSIVYDNERTPKTNYPLELIKHLSMRFNLNGNLKLLELGFKSLADELAITPKGAITAAAKMLKFLKWFKN